MDQTPEPLETSRPNPFVGPRPFQQGEKIYGRERETRALLNLLVAERIVLFHSPSGAGKTSLVQAGLLPLLATRPYRVLPVIRINLLPEADVAQAVRSNGKEINRYVYSAINSLEQQMPEADRLSPVETGQLRLAEYLERMETRSAPGAGPVNPALASALPPAHMTIFDQFEEILTLDPVDQPAKQEFFKQLGEALENRRRWALFVIREDYLAALDPFTILIPTRFKTTFRLDLLNKDAAKEAVQRTAQDGGAQFSDAAADKLIQDLRMVKVQQLDGSRIEQPGPHIEPVQLQVVCRRLWDQLPPSTEVITEQQVSAVGDVNESLAAYYAERVNGIAGREIKIERAIREWFQHELITENDARGVVLMGEDSSQGLDNTMIHRLENAHLVRAEQRAGSTWFELAHDRLLVPIKENNESWFRQHLSTLQRQAALWEREKRPEHLLLRGDLLTEAETWADGHGGELIEVERDFLEASQTARQREQEERERQEQTVKLQEQARLADKLRRRLVLAVVAAVIALLFFAAAAYFGFDASQQRDNAATNAAIAQAASTQAVGNAITADANAELANAASTQASVERAAALAASTQAVTQQIAAESAQGTAEALAAVVQAEATAQVPVNASRLVASQGLSLLDINPSVSALLGIESYRIQDTWESLNLLLLRLQRQTGSLIRPYGGSLPDQPFPVNSVAISPDGKSLAWGRNDGSLLVREIETADQSMHTRHTQLISSVAYSPSGDFIATGGYDRVIYLWEVSRLGEADYRPTRLVGDPQTLVLSLSFSPDGNFLAAGVGQYVIVFELRNFRQVNRMQHSDYVYSLAWSPSGEWIAGGDADGRIIIWDPDNAQRFRTPTTQNLRGVIYSLAWTPDSQLLLAGDQYGHVLHYDSQMGVTLQEPQVTDRPIWSVDVSRNGRLGVAGASDGSIYLWDLLYRSPTEGEDINFTEFGVDYLIYDVDFTNAPGPNLLAVGGYDGLSGNLSLFEVLPANPLYETVETGLEPVYGLGFSRDGLAIGTATSLEERLGRAVQRGPVAYGGRGENAIFAAGTAANPRGEVSVLDLGSGQVYHELAIPDLYALAISSDGSRLAASTCTIVDSMECTPSTIQIWDLQTGELAYSIEVPDDLFITALAFHPKEDVLIAGPNNGNFFRWRFLEEQPLEQLPIGIFNTSSLAYSPDGRFLAATAYGVSGVNSLVLLDGRNFQPIGNPLEGITSWVFSLAFDPLNGLLYSGEENGTVLRWNTDPELWIERNCALAGRNLTKSEIEQYLPDKDPNDKTCPQYP